jgi:hypothetical protein
MRYAAIEFAHLVLGGVGGSARLIRGGGAATGVRLVLSCLIHASCWANAPRWGGRLRCWLAAPLPLPQTWTCRAVQIVTRVPLSLYLGPRLVNVVSLRKRPNSLYLQNKLSPYLDALACASPCLAQPRGGPASNAASAVVYMPAPGSGSLLSFEISTDPFEYLAASS